MARRSANLQEAVSLFPFLSILAATLGALLMVMLSLTTLALGPGKGILPVVAGQQGKKTPSYLEWDGDTVTIHPSGEEVPWALAAAKKGHNDTAFGQLLTSLAAHRDRRYVVVLVRPSGFSNFGPLKQLVRDWKLDIGYEPIDQDWDIRTREGQTHAAQP